MTTPRQSQPDDAIRDTAAAWTIRRDRGLSAAESIEFELWLAADERHAAAMRRSADAWSLLDRMPESAATPVFAAAGRRRAFWRRTAIATSLAAAAAFAVIGYRLGHESGRSTASPIVAHGAADPAAPRQFTLSDGSVVHLNTGGAILEQFTPSERRVLLTRGEAHFTVTKNPARPFVVQAGGLRVRAVGTAFNVNVQTAHIEVLVTEGRVQLASGAGTSTGPLVPTPASPLVEAGQRAVVPANFDWAAGATADAIVVSQVDAVEIARALAWQDPLLRLGGATLAEVAIEFERRSGQRVILADPSLAEMRVGGRFRADDADGFAHLLATTLDLAVERAADGTIVLRKKSTESR